MSRAASNAVPCSVRFASVPAAVGTPKGLTVSSRGQGHVSCARRPRIASLPYFADPEGVERFGPARIDCRSGSRTAPTSIIPIRRFHLRLLTVFPLRGTGQRSNCFESHWSIQWLTLELAVRSQKSEHKQTPSPGSGISSADPFCRSAVRPQLTAKSRRPSPHFSSRRDGRCRKGGALQAAEKPVQAVILSSSEGSGFEFSSHYRFFVASWLLRMTVLGRFPVPCKAPPFQNRGEKCGLKDLCAHWACRTCIHSDF